MVYAVTALLLPGWPVPLRARLPLPASGPLLQPASPSDMPAPARPASAPVPGICAGSDPGLVVRLMLIVFAHDTPLRIGVCLRASRTNDRCDSLTQGRVQPER